MQDNSDMRVVSNKRSQMEWNTDFATSHFLYRPLYETGN